VSGDLTLHGVTRRVIIEVTREDNAYVGTACIKQTEFGIQPIKIGGGVVKVKDELEIRFRVYTASR
jgi:polyisoprenoid-binding protein YceI